MIKKISIPAFLLIIIGLIGCIFTFKTLLQDEKVFEEKIIKEEITDIKINADNAKIELIPTDQSSISLHVSGSVKKHSPYLFKTDVNGHTLSVNLEKSSKKLYSFDFVSDILELKVYIPEKVYESIRVNLSNGYVSVEGLQTKMLDAKTTNGKIEINHIDSENTTAEVENGSILLNHVEGSLTGKITNGNISLNTSDLEQGINFETINGKINIVTEQEPKSVKIKADVVNGKVNLFGTSTKSIIYGNGDHDITLSTINGNITLNTN